MVETRNRKGGSARSGGRRSKGARAGRRAVATLKDIAKVARVSAQTVSCVVNNTGSVSEEVRERVRRIADRMGYRPNKSAKAMRTGRSQTLGLVMSDLSNPFFPELAQAVERAASAAGYAVLLVEANISSPERAERMAALKSHPVDGVIATEYSPALARLHLPTVVIGGPVDGMDSVRSDDTEGGIILADHLLAKGHRKFGMVTGPMRGCTPVRRSAFLKRIAGEADVLWEGFTPEDESITDEILAKLRRSDATAIVCSNDLIAIGVLRALREMGRRVPDEVSVSGFDDIPWAAIVTPALTTVRQPFAALGADAVDLVIGRITSPRRKCRSLKLGMNLVERDSVAEVPRPRARAITSQPVRLRQLRPA